MLTADPFERRLQAQARSAPYLDVETERRLVRAYADSRSASALDQIVASHLRLVLAQVFRFRGYGLPYADLVQEGSVGLMEAATRFDPARELRFSTYATWWVRASIQDYVLRNWSLVRGGTSSSQKALFFHLRRLKRKLGADAANVPADLHQAVADAVGVSVQDVARLDARLGGDVTLNAPVSDAEGSSEMIDLLPSLEPGPDEMAERSFDEEHMARIVKTALSGLSERERDIVVRRRLADEPETLDQIGQDLGISKERVRQIEARAFLKMKGRLDAAGGRRRLGF